MPIVFFLVAASASLIGTICGIGGGIIIKPLLDILALASVPEASFLSGMTVLAMSTYAVVRSRIARAAAVNLSLTTPLAIGAVIGGAFGKWTFSWVENTFANLSTLGILQSGLLLALTVGTFAYNITKNRIDTLHVGSKAACSIIGVTLGFFSSFIGIGGGPMNLVVLIYFFSMPIKTAALNSLYIIFFSQAANFLWTVLSGSIPPVHPGDLALMIFGGLAGSMLGYAINSRIRSRHVEILFNGLLAVIAAICLVNIYKFS